jgi:hypothetical protein
MSFGDKPFGLHEVHLINLATGGFEELPVAQTLKFGEAVTSETLEGNDQINAVVTFSKSVEWELEAGGISLAAYALMTGRTPVPAGTTPSSTYTLTGRGAVAFPYFKIRGKVLGEGLDDLHCLIAKCKLTDNIEGEFAYGKFFVTKCKGIGVDDGVRLWEFVANETAAALGTT